MYRPLYNDAAKIRKKLVKSNGFWKINAIRPKIKAKRGKTRKLKKQGNAKLGGLVKELGFQIVTRIGIEKVIKPPSKIKKNIVPLTVRWYPPRDTQSRGPSLIPQTATFCITMDNPKDSSFAAQN